MNIDSLVQPVATGKGFPEDGSLSADKRKPHP